MVRRAAPKRLSGEAVSLTAKDRVAAAGIKAAPWAHRQRRRREGQANHAMKPRPANALLRRGSGMTAKGGKATLAASLNLSPSLARSPIQSR